MYTIEKEFSADLAHRVYNQKLDKDLCDGSVIDKCGFVREKCRSLHGHTARIIVELEAQTLVNDMVLDFNMIGFFKKLVDNYLDHHTLLYRHDPFLKMFVEPYLKQVYGYDVTLDDALVTVDELSPNGYNICQFSIPQNCDKLLANYLDQFVILDFNSTSERLAKWMYDIISSRVSSFKETQTKIDMSNVKVRSVSYCETPKSKATYRA